MNLPIPLSPIPLLAVTRTDLYACQVWHDGVEYQLYVFLLGR